MILLDRWSNVINNSSQDFFDVICYFLMESKLEHTLESIYNKHFPNLTASTLTALPKLQEVCKQHYLQPVAVTVLPARDCLADGGCAVT